MGAYTWTFVRTDKLTKEIAENIVKDAMKSNASTTYGSYSKMPFEDALSDWLKMHEKNHDYFIECGVPLKHLTKEYLTKKLKKEMKHHENKMLAYEKFLSGNISFEEMLKESRQKKLDILSDIYLIKRKNHYFANIEYEVFRNFEYGEKEFHTVDSLIEHCKNRNEKCFIDYQSENKEYREWNEEIEKHVRDFYSQFGDDNFYVHFG